MQNPGSNLLVEAPDQELKRLSKENSEFKVQKGADKADQAKDNPSPNRVTLRSKTLNHAS